MEPERVPITFTSLRSAAYSWLSRARGGGKRNCEGRVSTHGVMVAVCGVAPEALVGGVGRQTPTFGAPGNGSGGGGDPPGRRGGPQGAGQLLRPPAPPGA